MALHAASHQLAVWKLSAFSAWSFAFCRCAASFTKAVAWCATEGKTMLRFWGRSCSDVLRYLNQCATKPSLFARSNWTFLAMSEDSRDGMMLSRKLSGNFWCSHWCFLNTKILDLLWSLPKPKCIKGISRVCELRDAESVNPPALKVHALTGSNCSCCSC